LSGECRDDVRDVRPTRGYILGMPETFKLALHTATGQTVLAPSTLLVAIDETGHEAFADPHYPVFGLGGCACVIGDYPRLIRDPWRAIKDRYFGGADKPLHAVDVKRSPQEALGAVSGCFRNPFGRFAAVTTDELLLAAPMSCYEAVGHAVVNQVARIASHFIFHEAVVLFEESERTAGMTQRFFSTMRMKAQGPSGMEDIPVTCFFGSKQLAEPICEVADFVMHAAGTAVNAHRSGTPLLNRKDFQVVFQPTPDSLGQFLHLMKVEHRSMSRDEGSRV
jgi:hypothetical protein